jgi:hypothetical protein
MHALDEQGQLLVSCVLANGRCRPTERGGVCLQGSDLVSVWPLYPRQINAEPQAQAGGMFLVCVCVQFLCVCVSHTCLHTYAQCAVLLLCGIRQCVTHASSTSVLLCSAYRLGCFLVLDLCIVFDFLSCGAAIARVCPHVVQCVAHMCHGVRFGLLSAFLGGGGGA